MGLCQNLFGTAPFSIVRMNKVQGAKTEAEGSILRYLTEGECRTTSYFSHDDTLSLTVIFSLSALFRTFIK